MRAPALALWFVLASAGAHAQAPRAAGPPLASESARVEAARADSLRAVRRAERPPDRWIARDKALHTGGSFLLVLSGQYVLTDKARLSNAEALPVSAGTTLALGLLKEVADSRRPRGPHFSWRDLAADALGIALGALVVAW